MLIQKSLAVKNTLRMSDAYDIINNQIMTPTCDNLTKMPYFLSTIKLVYISYNGYVTKLLLQDEEGYCKFSLHFILRSCY